MKEVKKMDELLSMIDILPPEEIKNVFSMGMLAINRTFSEIHKSPMNIDAHFLIFRDKMEGNTVREALELYFTLKNLNNRRLFKSDKGIIANSWKNNIILTHNEIKKLTEDVKRIRNRLLELHG